MTVDITNTFIQNYNTKTVEDQRDMMKIRRKLEQILVDIDPEMYGPYIKHGNGKIIIIPEIIKIIIHNVNGIITIQPKVEKGYVSHWFQSKSLLFLYGQTR